MWDEECRWNRLDEVVLVADSRFGMTGLVGFHVNGVRCNFACRDIAHFASKTRFSRNHRIE